MNSTALTAVRNRSNTWLAALLGIAALLAAWFIVRSALPYLALSPDRYGPHFWERRWWLVFHIVGGVAALSLGLVQVWLGLTNRVARVHRTLGRLYVISIFFGSMAAFHLATSISGNLPYASGLFMLCVAWVLTTFMAVLAIRRRQVQQHRAWMMRSFAVTFAFVTFRFGVDALIARGVPVPDTQAIMAWACWAVPLLLMEPLLQMRNARGR